MRHIRLDGDGPAPTTTTPTIVVGHSIDPESDDALDVAIDLARRLGAVLRVVHGADLDDHPIDADAPDWEERAQQAVAAQRARVADRLSTTDLAWCYDAGSGEPAALLSRVAREDSALMIVVGSRGRDFASAVARLLGGSVSREVIGEGGCPVLVVPPRS